MIEEAMLAERHYLEDRLAGKQAILDLSVYGYNDLAKYFSDKRDYQLKHCGIKVHETTMDNIESRVEAAVISKIPSLWIPTADEVFVWHGNESIDEALCAKLGVRIYDMNYIGGTIVSGPEDLSLAVLIPESVDISTFYMLSKIKMIMDQYFDSVVIDGNDVLIDEKKVLGSMNRRVNGIYVFACQISYVDRSEYISKLCSKQSVKIPGYINSAVLPKDVLKSKVIECLQ